MRFVSYSRNHFLIFNVPGATSESVIGLQGSDLNIKYLLFILIWVKRDVFLEISQECPKVSRALDAPSAVF